VKNSHRNRPTLPRSDFDAPSGFLNLAASCSFRCFPSVFQPSRTPRVSVLQRFPLFGCRLCRDLPPNLSYPLSGASQPLPPCTPLFVILLSKDDLGVRQASKAMVWLLSLTSSFEGVCPSWLSRCMAVFPSFERLAACSACLQGFELPKSPFCRRLL